MQTGLVISLYIHKSFKTITWTLSAAFVNFFGESFGLYTNIVRSACHKHFLYIFFFSDLSFLFSWDSSFLLVWQHGDLLHFILRVLIFSAWNLLTRFTFVVLSNFGVIDNIVLAPFIAELILEARGSAGIVYSITIPALAFLSFRVPKCSFFVLWYSLPVAFSFRSVSLG